MQHIAIVDDDEVVLRAMVRMLVVHSFQARSYASAFEFLEALEGGGPDCLITDFRMNEMTGLELLRHLGSTGLRIPTIIMTADDNLDLQEQCELAGAISFLVKPVNGNTLLEAVRTAAGEKTNAQNAIDWRNTPIFQTDQVSSKYRRRIGERASPPS